MGRPRQHDLGTRERLLDSAERLVAGGTNAVTVRAVADQAGTTTRAVYSVFGSKEGLLDALAQRAFELLIERVDTAPITDDPGADLISAALRGYRPFARERPDLFRLVFAARLEPGPDGASARENAYSRLIQRVQRARDAGLLGAHPPDEVALHWDAMCYGLAIRELGCALDPAAAERLWDEGLRALLRGFRDGPRAEVG
jgi:AcrR family transcriptional regulator